MKQSTIINNRKRASQLLAFDHMQYGKCRPTDIDLSMDWQGKFFTFVELKGGTAPLTIGQKIHLMGLVDAIEAGGREAIAILAHHNTPDTDHDVHVAESIVHSVYQGGQWEKINIEIYLDTYITSLHDSYQVSRKINKGEAA